MSKRMIIRVEGSFSVVSRPSLASIQYALFYEILLDLRGFAPFQIESFMESEIFSNGLTNSVQNGRFVLSCSIERQGVLFTI